MEYSGTRKDLLPLVTTWMDFEHYAKIRHGKTNTVISLRCQSKVKLLKNRVKW